MMAKPILLTLSAIFKMRKFYARLPFYENPFLFLNDNLEACQVRLLITINFSTLSLWRAKLFATFDEGEERVQGERAFYGHSKKSPISPILFNMSWHFHWFSTFESHLRIDFRRMTYNKYILNLDTLSRFDGRKRKQLLNCENLMFIDLK